jgi:hypothetical protein
MYVYCPIGIQWDVYMIALRTNYVCILSHLGYNGDICGIIGI